MRAVMAFLASWVTVTAVYLVAFWVEGSSIQLSEILASLRFILFVSGLILGYMLILGAPLLVVLFRRQAVRPATFVMAGLTASLPMLVISVISKEPEWIVATILAGCLAGSICAFFNKRERT